MVSTGEVSGLLGALWGGGDGLLGAVGAGGESSVSAPPRWFVSAVGGSWADGVIGGVVRSTGSEAGGVISGTARSTGSEAGGVEGKGDPVVVEDEGGPGVRVVDS